MPFVRYAVYYLPPEGSALARFGAHWLGWECAAGRAVDHTEVALPGDLTVAEITGTPRKYGFHGTLKPPFRLTAGRKAEALDDALSALAARTRPFDAPALRLAALGRFLALVPSAPCPALDDLAAAAVRDLDAFRAPPSGAELARRRAAGLSPRQEANLTRWGYPYVMQDFRFHMTLTGGLAAGDLAAVEAALAELVAPLCADPLPVREIALLGEVEERFHLIRRYPLTGTAG